MKSRDTYLAWFALLLAILLWGAVLYTAMAIRTEAIASADSAARSETQVDKAAYTQRIAALATDTAQERAALDTLVQSDIVSIIDIIEAAGKTARVQATVSDALPEGGAQEMPGGSQLQVVSFIVQAQGSFSSLMRAISLFEHLPLPSSVGQVELQYLSTTDSRAQPWRMTVRIRVLTTAASS